MHETGDAVHRVEKEVWIQLHTQRSQLRIRQLRFQTDCCVFSLSKLLIVADSAEHQEDNPEDNEVVDHFRVDKITKSMQVAPRGLSEPDIPGARNPDRLFHHTDNNAQGNDN